MCCGVKVLKIFSPQSELEMFLILPLNNSDKHLPKIALQVGDLIALTVEEGQDWKDVQIPGAKAKAAPAPTKSAAAASPTANVVHEPVDLHFVPGIGPATNLLLAQYGLEPR